jgi:hypothetical protein
VLPSIELRMLAFNKLLLLSSERVSVQLVREIVDFDINIEENNR